MKLLPHYIKTGIRSLLRYKQQTIISMICLAIGFACFTLSYLWIRYESSFDNFHTDADRIFMVTITAENENGFNESTPFPLAHYLSSSYPEIKAACNLRLSPMNRLKNNEKENIRVLFTDHNFFDVFGVEFYQNETTHLLVDGNKAIVSKSILKKIIPETDSALGKAFEYTGYYGEKIDLIIEAIVQEWPSNSNLQFDIIRPIASNNNWNGNYVTTYIRLKEDVDVDAFIHKLENTTIYHSAFNSKLHLIPLKEQYYTLHYTQNNVKYEHLKIFLIAGLLVICSALFNFITLFIIRQKLKREEIIIRKINGASNKNIFLQLITEILIITIISLILGLMIIEWIFPWFVKLTVMPETRISILPSLLSVSTMIFLSITFFSCIFVWILNNTLLKNTTQRLKKSKNNFFRFCIGLQLCLSILFLFCTSVISLQIYHLTHIDIGFDRQNIASCSISTKNIDSYINEINKIPSIKNATAANLLFLPSFASKSYSLTTENGNQIDIMLFDITPELVNMLNFRFINGTSFSNTQDIILNETAYNLLGETYELGNQTAYGKVTGIVKDFLYESPLVKSKPAMLRMSDDKFIIYYKYEEGTRFETEKAVKNLAKNKFNTNELKIYDMNEEYDKYLSSEKALMKILGFLSVTCSIIAIFGIYSMVSLSAEQRRKEIAIRKVNGASAFSLLALFAKEYLYILLFATFIAFSIGFIILQNWLERYVNRIEINALFFISIFVLVSTFTILTIIIRVWNTIKSNPADELKRE
ncbi:FtsX-like permease family protein [Coprobacter tertius]|uniref:ABC transporter permease n=1 Tax=Coprobacter tertius TaxID=2944915 RepID=A0ABT1MIB9_9BACT|nr:FtsX-like permease family protein [Coprobacter tertius]MCP9612365.1 ABC transporter permease [Coprobacter tertius]